MVCLRKREKFQCSGRDLNPHAFRHTPLKRTCLPFHHPSVRCLDARKCPATCPLSQLSFAFTFILTRARNRNRNRRPIEQEREYRPSPSSSVAGEQEQEQELRERDLLAKLPAHANLITERRPR